MTFYAQFNKSSQLCGLKCFHLGSGTILIPVFIVILSTRTYLNEALRLTLKSSKQYILSTHNVCCYCEVDTILSKKPRICQVLATSFGEGNGTPLQYSRLENPMDGGAWQALFHGVAELDTTERLHFHFSLSCIGEGNSNPLQYSCLDNPRDGRAWQAAIYRVAQSRTWLIRLSSSSSSHIFKSAMI